MLAELLFGRRPDMLVILLLECIEPQSNHLAGSDVREGMEEYERRSHIWRQPLGDCLGII